MENIASDFLSGPRGASEGKQVFNRAIYSQATGMVGKHCILELYDCDQSKLNDESFVRATITNAARLARANLIELISHRFHPQGLTALALLSESHISIHTWPESGYAAIDVFTCGENTMPEIACESMKREFEANSYSLQHIQRKTPFPSFHSIGDKS